MILLKLKHTLFSILCALMFILPMHSQSVRLLGKVTDFFTQQPIDGAKIKILNTGKSTTSDLQGFFSFSNLSAGQFTLSLSHIAYAGIERRININSEMVDTIFIVLRPAIFQSEEVIIRSTRTQSEINHTPYPLDVQLSERITQSTKTTISDVLCEIPGIALARDGAWQTAVSIRGMGRSNIISLIDNTRIETANDIAGALSLINMNDLERVEIFKSSGSVLYGTGAFGGIVHFVTKQASFSEQPKVNVELTNGTSSVDHGLSHYASFNTSSGHYALRISGSYRNAGNTMTPNGELPNSKYSDFSINSSMGIKTIDKQTLFLTYQRSQADDTGIPGGDAFSPTTVARYTLARRELIGLEYNIPNVSSFFYLLTIRASRQEISRNVEIIQSPTITVTPHAIHTTYSAQLEAKLNPMPRHLLIVGSDVWERKLDSRREKYQKALNKVIGERPIPISKFFSGGIYLQDECNIAQNKLILVAGTRYDWIRVSNEQTYNPEYVITSGNLKTNIADSTILWKKRKAHDESWSANAGINYSLNPQIGFSFLAATAFRSPSLEERYQFIDLGGGYVRVGDPNLKPERSYCFNTGLKFSNNDLKIHVDIFLNQLTNLIAEEVGTFEGRPALVKKNIGTARLYGYEFSTEKFFSSLIAVKASISYVRGEDVRNKANLPQISPLNGEFTMTSILEKYGSINISCLFANEQKNLALNEVHTAGYGIMNINFVSVPLETYQLTFIGRAGVQNVFDKAYRNHLSTLRGIIKDEPGRNFYISITLTI